MPYITAERLREIDKALNYCMASIADQIQYGEFKKYGMPMANYAMEKAGQAREIIRAIEKEIKKGSMKNGNLSRTKKRRDRGKRVREV